MVEFNFDPYASKDHRNERLSLYSIEVIRKYFFEIHNLYFSSGDMDYIFKSIGWNDSCIFNDISFEVSKKLHIENIKIDDIKFIEKCLVSAFFGNTKGNLVKLSLKINTFISQNKNWKDKIFNIYKVMQFESNREVLKIRDYFLFRCKDYVDYILIEGTPEYVNLTMNLLKENNKKFGLF